MSSALLKLILKRDNIKMALSQGHDVLETEVLQRELDKVTIELNRRRKAWLEENIEK